jgi:hypothetical protein
MNYVGRNLQRRLRVSSSRPLVQDVSSRDWRVNRHFLFFSCLAVLTIVACAAFVTWPFTAFLGSKIPGHTDALFGLWRVSWIGGPRPTGSSLFDAPIFYPATNTLAYSDAILIPGLLTVPLRWLGVDQLLGYNLLTFAALICSGLGATWFCYLITRRWGPSVIAGVIFTLNPHRMEHLERIELLTSFFTPLLFACWYLARTQGSAIWAALAMLCVSGQFLSGMYEGLFLACVTPCVLVDLVRTDAAKRRQLIGGLVAGAIVTSVVVMMYSGPYFQARGQVGERSLAEATSYSATPLNFLAVHPRNWLLGSTLAQFGSAERHLFPGICAVLMGLVGCATADRRVRVSLIVVTLIALDLTFGLNGFLMPALREVSSAFRGIRVPARAATIVMLPIAVFAGIGFAWLTRRMRTGLMWATTIGAIAVICLEYRTVPILWDMDPPIDLSSFGIDHRSVLLEMPLPVAERLDISFDGHYMVSHIGQWPHLLNGYSGRFPREYIELLSGMRHFPDDASLAYAKERGATHLLVHERWMGETFPSVLYALERSSEVEFVGAFKELDSQVAVYLLGSAR